MGQSSEHSHKFNVAKNHIRELLDTCMPVLPALPLINNQLFHYTTASGIIGILNSASLRATACLYLNDSEEWHHGVRLARELLDDISIQFDGPVLRAIEETKTRLDKSEFASDLYVICFCGDGDQLNQWRAYAGKGDGYCIHFRTEEIELTARQFGGRLIQVVYDETAQKELLQTHIYCAISKMSEDCSTLSEDSDIWNRAASWGLLLILCRLIVQFKNASFSSEREVRILYQSGLNKNRDKEPDIRHREGRGFVIPYVELPFACKSVGQIATGAGANLRLPIRSIKCGPTTQKDLACAGIKSLLKCSGYELKGDGNDGVEVISSAIPYRG